MYKPELHHFVKQIYSFLDDATIDNALIESMKNRSIVWTGNGFCQPQKIYLNSSNDDIHLEPYLYQLPGEFLYMKDFFHRLGCKMCQSPELLVDVQEQIKQHHIQIRTEKEYRRDLRHNINILTFFKRSHSHCTIDYNALIPVETEVENQLSLKHIHECAYRSSHWSEDVKVTDEEEPFAVHPDITFAASIGIKSMEEHYLSDTGVLEWEQEMSLVNRIKSLLKGYRDGLSVPKELIQNADDAGATKVCFLYDERENLDCRTNLLNDKMSECQGPALWVYNNAQFSETDFKNITKVEGVTKDLSKIGKFGVGFCSVYNLTDVPSFVSGDIMVIFDPQGSCLKTKGMKIDMKSLKNQRMLNKWSDQFKPFKNIFGCDLSTEGSRIPHFDGTLFRLPLRTSQQSGSELSSLVYNHDEMRQMLEIFIKSAGNLLLFTQNVSEIEIFHLSDIDTRRKRLIFQASRNLKWHSPLTYKEDENDGKKRNKVPVLKHCSQQINNSSDKNANFGTYQYSAEVVMKFKETGKQFHGQNGNSTKTTWMVSWASGTNECVKQSMQDIGAHKLPIAATAVMIQDNNGKRIAVPLSDAPFGFYDSSHLFCVLPLPIMTPFNFHISGSFAVTQDRTQLSIESSDDKQRFELNWNRAVMKDAVVKSLFSLLQGLQEINVKPGKDLHLLWPVFHSRVVDLDIYKETQDRFIAELLTSNQKVIYQSDLDHWTQFSSCRMMDPQLSNSDVGHIAYRHSLMYLKDKGKILIQMPDWLLHQFTMSCGDTITDSLFTTVMFYEEVFLPLVYQGKVSDIDRNNLLLFAVDKNNDKINEILINHACFSTTRGILRKPSDIILKQSSLSKLFVPGDAYFLDLSVEQETEHRVELFKKLGMLYKSLPDCLIVDRCASVEKISKKCVYCAMQRCKDIFEYFERSPPKMNNELVNALTKIKFLPVMMKPKNWPFQWKVAGNEEMNKTCGPKHKLKQVSPLMHLPQFFTMECSENLYFDDCKDLICCTNLVVYTRAIHTKNVDQILQSLGLKGYKKTGVALDHVVRQTKILISQCDKENVKYVRPVLETIFEWLSNECKTSIDRNEGEMQSLLAPLQNSTCLLINDTLWSPNQVSLNFDGNCLPYLVGINQKDTYLSRCKTLLYFLDVKDRYSTNDISKVLMSFQVKIDIKEPIGEQHIHQYCSLLSALCIALTEEKIEEGLYPPLQDGEILVPDDANYLNPVHLLCLNDDVEIERSESMKFACKHISRAQANILGIISKKRKKISEHYNEMPFGQTEDLTTRIKKLLEGYPADEGIFKELLQNADDAGATEIHFVTDFNNYSSAKVFDGDFKELQGPSVLVYNNSSFAENDLKCIQLLGIGSKRKDPTSTGKYGDGFNAVYHLTDVPSFITKGEKMAKGNRTLCIFDPLCKYATAANKRKPGSRYCDLDALKDTVPDVFVPYHEECLMGDEGTIFRFPLRKTPSEISDNAMDTDQIIALLGKFKTQAGRSLFFLNHIRKVLFSRVENGQIINEYSVTIKMSQEDNRQKREFHEQRLNVAEKIKNRTQITTEHVVQIRTTMHLCFFDENNENVEQDEESWFVVETIGLKKGVVPKEVHNAYSAGGLGLLPQGGVALPLSNIAKLQFSAFCILPLPIITGLPMHVNGHFALNHESRRNLWEDNKESLEVIWNRTLMASVIAPSYIAALEKRRDICNEFTKKVNSEFHVRNQLKEYFKHFPSIKKAKDNNWKSLCVEIYRQIIEEIQLFPTISKIFLNFVDYTSIHVTKCNVDWICLRKKNSEFSSVFCLEEKESLDAYSVVSLMKLLNLQVIDLSCGIFEEMSACELEVKSVTPDIVVTFLQSHLNANYDSCKLVGLGKDLGSTTLKTNLNVDNLLNFCKKSSSFNQQLPGLPLCITNDNILLAYSEMTPFYVTKHCNIMQGLEEKFINKKIQYLLKDIISPCLKKFTLLEFEILIKDVICRRTYRESNTSFPWNPAKESIPNQNWLRGVWDYFAEVLSALKSSKQHNENDSIAHVLSKWYLLPIRRGQQYELERIGMSKYVIYRESFTIDKPLHDALQRIEMPELDTRIFWRENKITKKLQHFEAAFKVAKGLVVSCDNSLDVFECLVHNLRSHKKAISEDDCSAILEYINDNIETFELEYPINKILEKLRSIPVFITVSGYNTNVESYYTTVLVLPTNIPFVGIEEWANSSGIVLLKKITRITHLHIKLGFVACNTCELYSKYIIPNFQNMPQVAHFKHLEYIRDKIFVKGIDGEFKSTLKHLITELSRCPFLFKNNVLLCALNFCNPHNKLFSVMCKDDTFPPSPYNGKEWECFMEIIGMKMEATPEMVVMFAKEVAREGLQTLSLETKCKSKLLVMHLMNRADILEELNCTRLSEVKSIRFIEPFELDIDHRLSWIYEQYDRRKLVSFDECTLYDTNAMKLVWTSTYLMPDYVTCTTNEVYTAIGVRVSPAVEHVVQNLQNIAVSVHEKCSNELEIITDNTASFFEDLFVMHYMYLQNNGLMNTSLLTLKTTQIVFVKEATICLLCQQIVMQLEEKEVIKPYLMRLPVVYRGCMDLFISLGSTAKASSFHFAEVLKCLHNDSLGDNGKPTILGPNERKDILVPAVRNLFLNLQLKMSVDFSITDLFLPNRDFILHSSQSLIVSDNNRMEERAKHFTTNMFFAGFEKLGLQEISIYSFKSLPDENKPKFLSELLTETIFNALECYTGDKVQMLSRFIKTDEFIEGLLRLVFDERLKHPSEIDINHGTWNFNEHEQGIIAKSIGEIKVKQVSDLETVLLLEGRQLEESTERKNAFVESVMIDDTRSWILYCIDNEMDLHEWLNSIQFAFVKLLEQITVNKIQKNLVFVQILLHSISNPALIKDKFDMESIAHLNSKNVSADIYPDPGTYVPLSLHYLLDNYNSDFAMNDYVALLLYEEEENSTGQFIDPVYIYAKVINCINDSQNLSRNCNIAQFEKVYLLDVGETEEKQIPAYKIFKFQRKRALTSKSKDVVPTDNAFHSANSQTVDELLNEVKEHFIEILKITDETKRRLLIRRLRAKWHPDQNFGNEEKTTQVFQFIESLIRDLKDGKIIDEEFNRQSRYKGEDIPSSPYFAPPPKNNSNSFSSHNRFTHGVNREKIPIPKVARKWLRQAKCDRQAAEALNPYATPIPAFNWICYHCHQSAEKALKAMWYNLDANNVSNSHELSSIANGLPEELTVLARAMVSVVGHHTRMRYPDQISGDDIPSTIYSQQDADQCLSIASDIISFVSQRVQ
ncbi:sacsin-like [Mytilus californianus]|uniref:sacsin-like n=1 Tax=Mytilus californianus TaxID=6549 RepID=UPI002245D89F|nr:sacsin-like [Mytilus californianus]